MTELRFEPFVMPAADLGAENPLPSISLRADLHSKIETDDTMTEEEGRYFGFGKVNGMLPYTEQNGYNRVKKPRAFNAAVLENDHIKAIFLPEAGGRLWSLFDKDAGRELLHVNPVFQPANLAIRNAWLSGGVEWNVGFTGHTPFTVSQIFTAKLTLDDGTPVLRMYEWERVRRVSYEIDAWLPEDSKFLYLRMKMVNTRDEMVPIYWWSNIAVDETPDTRVVVPADKAFRYKYKGAIGKVAFPHFEGVDASYTLNMKQAYDFFFDIEAPGRRWIAALDGKGEGLVQTSTDRLIGRKLFVWGNNPGGRRWQEFLAEPGKQYLEIQAGVAHTQSECLPMPAREVWQWVEAYGMMKADPKPVHGEDWYAAGSEVENKLEGILPRAKVDAQLAMIDEALAGRKQDLVARGSGWAALEEARLKRDGRGLAAGDIVFDEASMTKEQAPWLTLLNTGVFPETDPAETPLSWMVQDEWRALLETSVNSGKSDHWTAWLHLGVMRFYVEDLDGARAAWETSIARKPSGWAYRCLGALLDQQDHTEEALSCYAKAVKMLPSLLTLAVEYGKLLIKAKKFADALAWIAGLPTELAAAPRIRTLEASAAVGVGDTDRAEAILMSDLTVPDIREGEVSLSDQWFAMVAARIAKQRGVAVDEAILEEAKKTPMPKHLDFRMHN